MSETLAKPTANETLFATEGWAVEPVFAAEVVKAAQADITDQIDRVARALHMPFERSRPDLPLTERLDAVAKGEPAYANLLRLAVLTDAHRGSRLEAMAESPELKAVATRLAGRALGGTSTVRVRASLAAFPQFWHAWHSDVAIDDGTDCGRLRITAWIPLMDAGPDSGGLEVATGRHAAPFPHVRAADFHIEEELIADLPRVRPACPAGSVLFVDRFTPHRTLPNFGSARYALLVWMKAA